MLNGIYGSFERERKRVEGVDVQLGCSFGIYTDMWDLGGGMKGNVWVGR